MNLSVQRGALLAKRLPISWAIHTPLMAEASRAFAREIQSWAIHPPRFPVLSYLRAEFLRSTEEIREELSAQFSRPNRWHEVLGRMIAEGIGTFIEVGPGSVLTQMVRWVDRKVQARTAAEILQKKGEALRCGDEPRWDWN